jgi:anti-sigma B factor antagonist
MSQLSEQTKNTAGVAPTEDDAPLTQSIERNGDAFAVHVYGRLDLATSPKVESAMKPYLDSMRDLTIDLGEVEYVSSMGLRLLLSLQKRMNKQGTMRVVGVNDEVMELFETTGFDAILTIEN